VEDDKKGQPILIIIPEVKSELVLIMLEYVGYFFKLCQWQYVVMYYWEILSLLHDQPVQVRSAP
jgi:hypothetical protein